MGRQFFEYTGSAIILLWVLTHSNEFGTAMASLTAAAQSGIRTLYGFS